MMNSKNCSTYFDGQVFWPETPADQMAQKACPYLKPLMVLRGYARRFCHSTGFWTDRLGNPVTDNAKSYTNFRECTGVISSERLFTNLKFVHLAGSIWGIIGLIGCVCSICLLSSALWVYKAYPTIRNFRIRIHRQLYIAFLLEAIAQTVLTTSVVYKALQPRGNSTGTNFTSEDSLLQDIEYCVTNVLTVSWEFFQTSVFAWTFVEGLHIHNLIVVSVIPGKLPLKPFMYSAWIGSLLITGIWLSLWLIYARFVTPWPPYTHHYSYYVLFGSRLTLLLGNLFFLINVLRVFVKRLRATDTPEIQQLKKATKAAFMLMPLLGIINAVVLIEEPLNPLGMVIVIGLQRLLPCWQGLIVAVIYCFMNRQVRHHLRRSVNKFRLTHCTSIDANARPSRFMSLTRLNISSLRKNNPVEV